MFFKRDWAGGAGPAVEAPKFAPPVEVGAVVVADAPVAAAVAGAVPAEGAVGWLDDIAEAEDAGG